MAGARMMKRLQPGQKPHVKNPWRIMKRILGYMLKNYKFSFLAVVLCILGSALATLRGTLFLQSLIRCV